MKNINTMHFFTNMKLKHKIHFITAMILLIISSSAIIGYIYVIRQYNRFLYKQTANSLAFFANEFSHCLDNIEDVTAYIMVGSEFQSNLDIVNQTTVSSSSVQGARNNITSAFIRYYTANMKNITLIFNDSTMMSWGKELLEYDEPVLEQLYAACDEANGKAAWVVIPEDNMVLCARKILKVKNLSLDPMGYLVIPIDLPYIVSGMLVPEDANQQFQELFIHFAGEIIYPSETAARTGANPAGIAQNQLYDIQKINNRYMFMVFSPLPVKHGDWNVSLLVPYDEIFQSLNHVRIIFMLVLIIAIIITLLLAGSMANIITRQFHILVRKMQQVKVEGITEGLMRKGQAGTVGMSSGDEMTMLNVYFDQMIVELKKLIEESYVKELLITQAELKALEQQVNPHFLYNTLNTIHWLAKRSDPQQIAVIAESLGNMLKSTLNNGRLLILLEKELEIVKSYVTIQKIRFHDLLVAMNVDQEALAVLVPKMTIQPLIENAIFHSQSQLQEEYRIDLIVECRTETVAVMVKNSGSVIDVDILTKLKNQTVTPAGNGIGLLNIDSRLRILFGDEYGLYFDNQNGMAVVSFQVPR